MITAPWCSSMYPPPEGGSANLVLELIQHHFTEGRKFSLA